ncbi:MAG TPA: DUF2330 domain-containing protein [Myxococcales bacterium]|nr:DUF2330 domain-containing protein [Myxococcales bacterium]
MKRIAAALFFAITLICAVPMSAQACGGFFCSQQQMDQSGENILFAMDGGEVSAHIQIFYQGEADRFAWVLPLPVQPTDIRVGTDMLFQQLLGRTQPRFQTTWKNNGKCYFYGWGGGMDDGDLAGNAGPTNEESEGGVEVLESGSVGPFDYHVIAGTNTESGEAVFQWLKDNDYDQPDMAKDLVTTYVAEKHVFVAVRLQSNKGTGDIQPLVLDFPFPGSCVPLRLTSIAAADDMPVRVWILGQHRAIPINYFHVEINEKKIDWMRNGNNYNELAIEAVDTAAGRGFLTEFAGDTNDMKGQLWQPGKYDTDVLKKIKTPWDFVQNMLSQNFPRNTTMQNLIRKHVPMPQSVKDKGVTEQQFYNNLQKYKNDLAGQPFDPVAFADDVADKLLKPLEEANQLFNEHRYMTRLMTMISASEMTRDPIFLFNPDLPNVNNVHSAVGKPYCKEGTNEVEKVVITLADGTLLEYEGPFNTGQVPVLADEALAGGPASAIQRMFTAGPPEDISLDRVPEVDKEFDSITVGLVASGALGGLPSGNRPGAQPTSSGEGGCVASNAAPLSGILVMGLIFVLGLGTFRRRQQP